MRDAPRADYLVVDQAYRTRGPRESMANRMRRIPESDSFLYLSDFPAPERLMPDDSHGLSPIGARSYWVGLSRRAIRLERHGELATRAALPSPDRPIYRILTSSDGRVNINCVTLQFNARCVTTRISSNPGGTLYLLSRARGPLGRSTGSSRRNQLPRPPLHFHSTMLQSARRPVPRSPIIAS